MNTVLIIDDEEKLRSLMARIISLENFTVVEAATLNAGLKKLDSQNIDVVLCDVKLPDGNGVDFVKEAKQKFQLIEFILLTAYGNITDGVQAIKNGAFDYIIKGDDNNKIIPLLHQAVEKVTIQKQKAISISSKEKYHFDNIIGESAAIKNAIQLAQKIAITDINVLLLGETGTGKEVFANAIHSNSKRNNQPFIAINCSAFSKHLLESELFGYKVGAYTGAVKDKKGLIELANNGTLFLDEIGEMNVELQAKLLRVLENKEFIKLGDEKTTKVNIRVIAATNRNLKTEIVKGNFREDLFYRLNGFTIQLPSLKERKEDIALLAHYFLTLYATKNNIDLLHINSNALQALQQYEWKGNIRELKNVIECAAILTDSKQILAEHLPYEVQQSNNAIPNNLLLATIEKQHIQKVLLHTKGNKTETAKLLGIGLTTLYRKIEEYQISYSFPK
ncbi:MAG: sigma-54-dependent Fis family transcriptional regulator [Bacteroidetes bacterium]|nr:sigma-54-dependent Fis family transcriptional regulator [Bacteroidota bacterium]MBS1649457.1 sigma-54-dependent Fis family transcriptional regulator [Bacteroidota bacterium]